MEHLNNPNDVLIRRPGHGRTYDCAKMTAVFKADENETNEKYSVSEWWLAPYADGVGAHQHDDNEEVFYVLEGTVTFLIHDQWIAAEKGTFIRIPPKTLHDFKNETNIQTAVLNFFIPGGFEKDMPAIVKWFEENNGDPISNAYDR